MKPRAFVAGLLAVATSAIADPAGAQQWVVGANADIASGISGGGPENPVLERARTRLRLGADLRVDEFPKDIYSIAMVAEVEPHASLGLDLRYNRQLSPRIVVDVGAIGLIFPESLVGPVAGLRYGIPMSPKMRLTIGPEVNVFVIGTDLPSDSVVWQILLDVGVHLDL